MRKVLFCFVVLVVSAVSANAAPKAEVWWLSVHSLGRRSEHEWNGALTGNLNNWFGVTADFSGVYGSGLNVYTYTFGPEVHAHLPLVKPFAHALFGGARLAGGGGSTSGFDMMLGGGIDAGHGPLAFRVAQFDWMTTRYSGFTDRKNVRVSS